jgi:hypothetical protein
MGSATAAMPLEQAKEMPERSQSNWAARLRRFATTTPSQEHCELCRAPIASRHAHLLEIASRHLLCACEACDHALGESQRFRSVRPMTEVLTGFRLSDLEWELLQLPIDLAFLFNSTPDGGPVALYPGPAGAMASAMSNDTWSRLAAANPLLLNMLPDVEALLVNRTKGARQYYRVSIDRCYALVGMIRTQWKGLSGGDEVWDSIARFFASLEAPDAFDHNRALIYG